MKTSNSYHWLIAIAMTIFSINVYSMGAGGGGSRTLTCAAGWKVETIRNGRTYTQQCVVDTATMSRPEYNKELNRAPQAAAPTPAKKPAAKKPAAKKPAAKKESNSCGEGFKPASDGNGCVASDESQATQDRRESSGATVQQDEGDCGDGGCPEQAAEAEDNSSSSQQQFSLDTNCGCPEGTMCTRDAEPGKNYGSMYEVVIEGSYVERPGVFYGRACLREKGSNAGKSADDGGVCEQQFKQIQQACFSQADQASTDCHQENDGIQAAMEATKAVGAASAVSVQMACSKLGEISKIANTSLGAWKTFCAATQSSCESACQQAKTLYEQEGCMAPAKKYEYTAIYSTIKENVNKCIAYKKDIAQAAQHAAAALLQAQAAKKCEDDVSGLTTASVDECKKNPNNPLCTDAQRCSNAEFAASNKVCQCMNNPSSKDCIAGTSAAGSRGVAGGNPFGSAGGSSSKSEGGITQVGSPTAAGENPFGTPSGRANEQNLGGAKGNASLGGNSGGAAGGGGGMGSSYGSGAAGTDGDKTKVNSGFYGGGTGAGGGGYFGRTAGAPGSAGGRANGGGVNYNKMAGSSQFDPRRYLAGMNGKGGEYINGPNLDIFKIVKNRIEAKKPTMLDPDFKK